jgi:hypothetical protein
MKLIASAFVAVWLMSGCVSRSVISHEDSPGVTNHNAPPILCLDATPPPCEPPRD